MKRTQIIAFLSICLAISQAPSLASEETKNPTTNDYEVIFESDQISCFQTLDYFVIQRNVKSGVGNDFLVKYKVNPEATTPCAYSPEVGDFEIKDEWAAYFADLKNDRLYLEHYTGPGPYTFSIWDLVKRRKVYEDFGSVVDYLEESVIYWKETGKATIGNCPELADWESHGLGGAIETKLTLTLSGFKTSLTNETRCSPRQ
jgi:hypothetical protein